MSEIRVFRLSRLSESVDAAIGFLGHIVHIVLRETVISSIGCPEMVSLASFPLL